MRHASPLDNTLSNIKGDAMLIRKPEIKYRVNLSKKKSWITIYDYAVIHFWYCERH